MSKLNGKVALVTGASKGIGAAIAVALAAEGAAVAVNYASSKEGADKVVASIKEAGGRAVAVGGSVAQAEDVASIVRQTVAAFGKIDILVNNAGVYAFAPLEALTEAEFHRQFNTNVLGLLLTTQAAVQHFPPDGGSVINISSLVTRVTPPMAVIYNATKGAVDAITHTLARELGPKKIRVNAINPGVVNTEGARSLGVIDGDFEAQAVAQTPLGRVGVPEDIGPIAVFLASSDGGWVNGETILAAGGMR
jgi:3-oxoacyl-[acyl-carrier protein] reductase